MYDWRKLSTEEREELLKLRKQLQRPWHSPHHVDSGTRTYHLTAACYGHADIIGASAERLSAFSESLFEVLHTHSREVSAWVVLPNHYHALVLTNDVLNLLTALGQLHGRTSFAWNGEDGRRGRQVWCKAAETVMKSEGHFHASVNYVHHNPVKHGYAKTWTEWPWSSAHDYLERIGREEAIQRWKHYPILDFGKNWDD